jgi:hypothetical protein
MMRNFTDGEKVTLFVLAIVALIIGLIISAEDIDYTKELECRDGIVYYTYGSNGARDLSVKIDKDTREPMLCQ